MANLSEVFGDFYSDEASTSFNYTTHRVPPALNSYFDQSPIFKNNSAKYKQDCQSRQDQQVQSPYILEINDEFVKQLFANPLFREWLAKSIINNSDGSKFCDTCIDFFRRYTIPCLTGVGVLFLIVLILILRR